MLEIFRNRLKIARNAAELSQNEFARRVDSTRSTVSGYEADGKEPDYNTLIKMCRVLDVSADYLLGLTDDPGHKSAKPSSDKVDVIRRKSESLSREARANVSSVFDNTCSALSPDVDTKDNARIRLWSRLYSVIASQRAALRSCVEATGGRVDVSAMAEIMSLQSELKNNVSALLDQFLQADLKSVSGLSEKDDTELPEERAM